MKPKETTDSLERKIQNKLRELKKENKLHDQTYKDIYPSGSTTPSANPAIKAHKPSKDYPARLITSHINAPQENLASLLNDILKPFIQSNPLVCKNSFEFVEKAKKIKLQPHEIMTSYDATALFPSVPINDATGHILDLLEEDPSLPLRTQLTPYDIIDLVTMCLSSSNFVYDGRHHTTNDSGPIGLSLMVTVSQIWMVHTMEEAIKIAKQRNHIVPKNINIYMDDCWCTVLSPPLRTGLRSGNAQERNPTADFNECLNAVHSRVQFTREEEVEKSIAFLDVFVTREDDGTLSTRVYRKPSNTNISIKPNSCQEPKTSVASFKGELCRCHRLCSSPEQIKKEIEFTLDLYEDNGHNRDKLKHIADNYQPPPHKPITKEKPRTYREKCIQAATESQTKALFEELPFRNYNFTDDEDKLFACIKYIPEIAHQMRATLTKHGINTTFTSGTSLKNLLCSKNKTQAPREKQKGIYKYTCTCSDKATYIGQTCRSYQSRWKEHGKAVERQDWKYSGLSQHYQHCNQPFKDENFEPVHTMQDKKRKRLAYNMRMREAFEIRSHDTGPGKGLNEDNGAFLKTDIWDPVLKSLQ